MRRALQTALVALAPLIATGVPVRADADWQENSDAPCDTGSPAALLRDEFPAVDFASLDPAWPDKTSPSAKRYHFTRAAVLHRGQSALRTVQREAAGSGAVVVVSHSAFLRRGVTGCWFENADYRIFDLDETHDASEDVRITQWHETRAGGMGRSREDTVPLGEGLPEDSSCE